MSQKYKFFISDRFLLVSDSDVKLDDEHEVIRFEKDEKILDFMFEVFDSLKLKLNTLIVVKSLDLILSFVWKRYEVIKAAGGYVVNDEKELLMIHRLGYWDMPKGKVEKGETLRLAAVREVEEECGVSNLHIESDSFVTMHLYKYKGVTVIKKSFWFLMTTNYKGELIPQIEEGIEQVKWMQVPLKNKILKESYSSVREVILHYSGN